MNNLSEKPEIKIVKIVKIVEIAGKTYSITLGPIPSDLGDRPVLDVVCLD